MESGETLRRTTITVTPHQSGLYGRVARLKPLLSERHLKACLEFAKKHFKDSQTVRDKVVVNYNWHVQRKPGTAHHLPDTIPAGKHGGVAASCFRGAFQRQGLGNWLELRESRTGQITEISLMKTWPGVLRTSDSAEGWPSNRTVTLSTQPRQCSSGLGTPLWMSVSGPARALTWTTSKISGVKWKWLPTDGLHQTWQNLRGTAAKNGRKSQNPCVQSLSCHTREDSML